MDVRWLRRSALLAAVLVMACGTSAASVADGGGEAPVEDGGVSSDEDGGAAEADGGSATADGGQAAPDGGARIDGGSVADGGSRADGGSVDGGRVDGGSADGGVSTDGGPQTACTPYVPRSRVPTLLIGPTGLENALLAAIRGATRELSVMMYELDVASFVDAFIALKGAGVNVRILLDASQTTLATNATARQRLGTAGVTVKNTPSTFTYSHSKVVILDRTRAIVMSANMNGYSMQSERNYGALLDDAEDVADLQSVFDTDWNGTGVPELGCTRLIVSPNNSRDRLTAFLSGAQRSIDMSVMYVTDTGILTAIKARKQAGVAIRILLADPGWITSNTATAAALADGGISVKYLTSIELHAKLAIVDGVAFIGSENFSSTSLNRNREVGVLLTEPGPAGQAAAQFVVDWGHGVTP